MTGPTAAFVVILAPIHQDHGLAGLLTAGLMAGVLLIALGASGLGSLIRFVPYPVTTGFTTGIAVVIATLQLKDALGLRIDGPMPDAWHDKVGVLWEALGTASMPEVGLSALTLALLMAVPRAVQRVPAPLVALAAASLVGAALAAFGVDVATLGTRFQATVEGVTYAGIPPVLPSVALPWGPGGLSFAAVLDLVPAALAIALLGAIESLLSAVIADGATGTRSDPNAELVGLGLANLAAPFVGGIAATGALARTATNIRSGARSPVAALVHAGVVLLAMLLLAPLVAWIPMAALAGLLLVVAWNMSELHHFVGLVRIAPKSDVFVLVTCFLLTVFLDMTVAVTVGLLLASVLFIRRMAEITDVRLQALDQTPEAAGRPVPEGVLLYEINGPLFFGAAQRAMDALHASHSDTFQVLVLHLGRVPVIDATGFAALENLARRLTRSGRAVVIAGPLPEPRSIFEKADLAGHVPGVHVVRDLTEAMERATVLVATGTARR